jgi:chaperone modulatory protein CbpM
MKPIRNLISIDDFCNSSNVEISFINSLNQTGLIEIRSERENLFIDIDQMPHLEKMVRLHYELHINLEGIETIVHLLNRINIQHDEILRLKNKLDLYE